jgi:hypothetical protein
MRPAPEGLNNHDHTSLPVYGAAQNAEYLPPFPVAAEHRVTPVVYGPWTAFWLPEACSHAANKVTTSGCLISRNHLANTLAGLSMSGMRRECSGLSVRSVSNIGRTSPTAAASQSNERSPGDPVDMAAGVNYPVCGCAERPMAASLRDGAV